MQVSKDGSKQVSKGEQQSPYRESKIFYGVTP